MENRPPQPTTHLSPFKSNEPTPNLQQSQTNHLEEQLQQSLKSQFQVITKLGSGAYGHVWKVKDKKTDQIFALKKVFSAFQNQVDAQRTYRQICYLQKLSLHENVVKLKKVIKADNDLDLYLLFEYMESDLFYGIKEDLLNDLHKKYIIYQLAKCLKYVHSAGLVHRDVKPSNVLINPNCEIRLCDFGLSRTLWRYNNQEAKLTEFIATRWYRAPEVLFGSQYYTTKSDMWSVGCLIYELYARRPLLPGNDTVEQIQKVLEFKGFPNSDEKKSFRIPKIQQILSLFDLEKKPLNEYFKYIQCEQVKQILIHLLEYNPDKRWSSVDLLNCSFLQQFREFESEIEATKQIKTGIPDNQRKTVEVYRNTIYNTFVQNTAKKCEKIYQKLQFIRENKDSQRNSSGRKLITRQSSHQNLTEQRRSRNLINSKSSASLHVYKGSKDLFNNTQRVSQRKNVSTHSGSKLENDVKDAYKVTMGQKPFLAQMKSKKNESKFEFSLNPTRRTLRKSQQKDKQSSKEQTLRAHYPQYLRSSTHNSGSKIPKMIQQKMNQQASLFTKSNTDNTKSSKLLRTSMDSKEKKSPYILQLEQSNARLQSGESTMFNKSSVIGQVLKGRRNLKQNLGSTNTIVRKLKRKAVVN